MDILRRELAPVIPQAWDQIEEEARRIFGVHLAGRKLVDFSGPHGWEHAAYNTGRLRLFDQGPVEGVRAGMRLVRPLVELRIPMVLEQMTLDTAGRGAQLDLEPVAEAARRIAYAEDHALFNGWAEAGIEGIIPSSAHEPVPLPKRGAEYPAALVQATSLLRERGVDGPYALVLGTAQHSELLRATAEGGYPVRHLIEHQVIDGPIVHAPAVEGGVVLSMRGGDFVLDVGVDLSIGYAAHDKERVELYITEAFTFHIVENEAAVPLRVR